MIIKDLIKKYEVFIKYIIVAIISFFIDITLFTVFNIFLGNKIIISTIMARVISSFINYLLNKNEVFNNKEKTRNTILKYYLLVVIQMLISALLVDNLYNLIKINASIIKAPVEFMIFICNYLIQKAFIFKNK